MAIANLAMATGNIGREGVGVNPLRGQNNVQGSCDMGSFPHEFSGYRHVSNDTARETFERLWGVPLSNEPGLRIPNMIDEAIDGSFKWLYVQGEDIAQSDPDTTHITAGLKAMECVIVQDLFLNETARYAHIFLPGASFLEKDGTFTNAERRISRVRKAIPPLAGMADWEVTMALANALGAPMHYNHPSRAGGSSSAGTSAIPPCSTCCARPRPGAAASIQLTDALKVLASRGHGTEGGGVHRGAVPRPPLRHRQQAGLPAHDGPVRLRAARPRSGVRALAPQVPG